MQHSALKWYHLQQVRRLSKHGRAALTAGLLSSAKRVQHPRANPAIAACSASLKLLSCHLRLELP